QAHRQVTNAEQHERTGDNTDGHLQRSSDDQLTSDNEEREPEPHWQHVMNNKAQPHQNRQVSKTVNLNAGSRMIQTRSANSAASTANRARSVSNQDASAGIVLAGRISTLERSKLGAAGIA